jgi:hypothetical protein
VLRLAFFDWLTAVNTAIIRRDALLAIGGWTEDERYASDFNLWMQLARRYKFVATSAVTANWRWHDAQLSSSQEKQWLARYRFRSKLLAQLEADGETASADELSELFRVIWENDLQLAWDEQRDEWLNQLLSLSAVVPNAPEDVRRRWALRSRIPLRVRPMLHEISRLCRTSLGRIAVTEERM